MKRCVVAVLLVVASAAFCSAKAWALSDVSRSFFVSKDSAVVAGDLVSTKGDNGEVVLADTSNGQRLVGVVIPTDKALLTLDTVGSQQKVQVATSGTATVFVSTLGGDIHAGDAIGVSPLSGIGMKSEGTLRTLGIAQADFTAKTSNGKGYTIRDKSGRSQQIVIGSVPVVIAIGNGLAATSQYGVVSDLQAFAGAIVGHQVSVAQSIVSFLVTIVAMAALIALVYGAIQGGIVAIGRNPLARASIYRSLLQVMATALLIVVMAGILLYLILR